MIGTHAKNRTYKYTMPRVKQPRVKAIEQPQVKQPRVKQPRVKAIKQLANVKQPSVPDKDDFVGGVGGTQTPVKVLLDTEF